MKADEKIVKCNLCNKTLGSWLITKNTHSDKELKYKCRCSCGGESFVTKTYNKLFFLPEENYTISDMKCENDTFSLKVNVQ